MKTLIHILVLLFVASTLMFVQCSNEDEVDTLGVKGVLQFDLQSQTYTKSFENIKAVIISITDGDGNYIYNSKKLELYNLNNSFLTESIELSSGIYQLVSFYVIDNSNNVLYITPVQGTAFSSKVDSPLPIEFTVIASEQNTLSIQVIDAVNCDCKPDDFGYVSFNFDLIQDSINCTQSIAGKWLMTTTGQIVNDIETRILFITQNDAQLKFFDESQNLLAYGLIKGSEIVLNDDNNLGVFLISVKNINLMMAGPLACLSCPVSQFSRITDDSASSYCIKVSTPLEKINYGKMFLKVYADNGIVAFNGELTWGINNIEIIDVANQYYQIKFSTENLECSWITEISKIEMKSYSCELSNSESILQLHYCDNSDTTVIDIDNNVQGSVTAIVSN